MVYAGWSRLDGDTVPIFFLFFYEHELCNSDYNKICELRISIVYFNTYNNLDSAINCSTKNTRL